METQKAQLAKLFTEMGYDAAAAQAMAASFLTPEEGNEPALDIPGVLQQAQAYAKPLLRTALKREFSPEFKGQYMGEAINKIVAASKGKIRRANYEDGNVERALADLVSILEQGAGNNESETTINELRQQLETLTQEKEQSITQLRNEYAEKENARLVYDSILNKLGALQNPADGKVSKRLSVDQAHAARTILRELGEEYVLRYDEEARDVALYNKANSEEKLNENVSELVERSLQRNNWIAQSNGGALGRFTNSRLEPQEVPIQGEASSFRKRLEAQVGKTC